MNQQRQDIDALIFDSGVGGLSILREILQLMPKMSFVYIADNAGLPYGDKSSEWLENRVSRAIGKALQIYSPRVVVLACNTASTQVLPKLRAEFSPIFVGVVPAIKPAALLSKTRVLGLLATPGTIARGYTDRLIADYAPDCQVIRVGSSRLVELVEAKLRGQALPLAELRSICQAFIGAPTQPDTLVLGCTHFPFARHEIASILPGVNLVDSGLAIAQRVQTLLSASPSLGRGQRYLYFTSLDTGVQELTHFLEEYRLLADRELELD